MKVIVFDFDETLGHFGQLGDFIVSNLEKKDLVDQLKEKFYINY